MVTSPYMIASTVVSIQPSSALDEIHVFIPPHQGLRHVMAGQPGIEPGQGNTKTCNTRTIQSDTSAMATRLCTICIQNVTHTDDDDDDDDDDNNDDDDNDDDVHGVGEDDDGDEDYNNDLMMIMVMKIIMMNDHDDDDDNDNNRIYLSRVTLSVLKGCSPQGPSLVQSGFTLIRGWPLIRT